MFKKVGMTAAGLLVGMALQAAQIEVWFHAGKGEERDTINAQVEAFNKMQKDVEVKLVLLPEGSYNDQVNAAALAGDLPDLLDFDGPFVANYVWSGYLQPIDKLLDPAIIQDLLPSIIAQGTYPGDSRLYSVGVFDSGLGLWGNKDLLKKAGVRIPQSWDDAWTMEEFEEALTKLSGIPEVKWPLDVKLNYGKGEWYTYGFSPLMQSFGGDLIDRTSWQSENVLNNNASVEAMKKLQAWNNKGWIVPASAGDNQFYGEKNVGLAWVGHWMWNPHKEGLGDDLVLLPMPKFGNKAATGMGSWNWGISQTTENPEAVVAFLEFLLSPKEILRMTDANGAVPSRKSAIVMSPLFRKGGPLNTYIQQLNNSAVPRPFHPGYPTITSAYAEAVDNILSGADVKSELDKAVTQIQEDIADNDGYPPFSN